jgi:glycosyltransferase involved in cell wall biosynthesis
MAVTSAGLRLAVFTDTYSPQVNGVARTIDRLVPAIEARGGAVHVVTVDDPAAQPRAGVDRWPSVPLWLYPQLRMSAPSRHRALDLIERWRPTLVHVVTEFGVGLGGLFAAREAGVPVVTSYHTHFRAYMEFYGLSALEPLAWPYFRWVHNLGRLTFVPSRIVACELAAHGFRDLRVWSRGVDTSRFNPGFRTAAMRQRLGAAGNTTLVVYVGRLAREKGIHVLVSAMQLVRQRATAPVAFAVVGDGPAEAEFRAAAPADTVFTGRLDGPELSEAYAAADIFAFPSVTETFGNVVLEAMASGPAVIAPDVGATTEYATRETAMQFSAGDAEALAGAILALVGDQTVRRRLQVAALGAARARTWDAVWDGLMRDYREAVAASQAEREMAAMRHGAR